MASSSAITPGKRARRIALLRRRADHLEQRIEQDPNRQADRDRAELAALRWAAEELERKGITP